MENIKVTLDDGSNLRLDLPITKVDKENRLVSGFATLDNLDKHGDVVEAEASRKAFTRFEERGNIREMHMPVAVGKMVKFEERGVVEKSDDGEDVTYNGIYVTARVSKGAQTTWEKVLDGTLSGFSIGAVVKEKEEVFKDDGTHYRVIKDYELFELSLVDSPANPMANVVTVMKVTDDAISGIAVEANAEDEDLMLTQHDDTDVEDEAVVEKSDKEDSVIERFIDRFAELLEKRIGGNNMADKIEKSEEAVEETAATVEAEETVEKAEEISEVEVEETAEEETQVDTDSLIDSVVEKVLERLSATADTSSEVVTEEEVATDDEGAEVTKSIDGLTELVKSSMEDLSNRVKSLEDASAVKKSVDADRTEEEEHVQKSTWGGIFSGDLSVDSL